jgi:hypothetical protein
MTTWNKNKLQRTTTLAHDPHREQLIASFLDRGGRPPADAVRHELVGQFYGDRVDREPLAMHGGRRDAERKRKVTHERPAP